MDLLQIQLDVTVFLYIGGLETKLDPESQLHQDQGISNQGVLSYLGTSSCSALQFPSLRDGVLLVFPRIGCKVFEK